MALDSLLKNIHPSFLQGIYFIFPLLFLPDRILVQSRRIKAIHLSLEIPSLRENLIKPPMPYSTSSQMYSYPDFIDYDSYYLTWDGNGASFEKIGPYGELLPPPQVSLYGDFDSFYGHEQEDDDFTGIWPWNPYRMLEWGHNKEMERPYNEFDSYGFDSWGKNMFSNGLYDSGVEKADDNYLAEGEMYDSYDEKIGMQSEDTKTYDYNLWSVGFSGWFGHDEQEDYRDYGFHEPEPLYGYSLDEMRLYERIFGGWPGFSGQDQVSCVEQGWA